MAGLFASMAIYYFLLTFDSKIRQIYPWILFSLSITALVFTDYVPVFLLPLFWLFSFIKKQKKDWWKKFILSHIPLVLSGALWLPIFLVQLERGAWLMQKLPAWSRLAGGATPKQALLVWAKFVLGRISFKDKAFYYSLIGISSLPFIYSLNKALKERKKICIIWSWLLVPLTLTFIASLVFPAFIYFRFLYVVPAFYLLVAWGVNQIKDREKRVLIGGLLLAVTKMWLFLRIPNLSPPTNGMRKGKSMLLEQQTQYRQMKLKLSKKPCQLSRVDKEYIILNTCTIFRIQME